MSAHLASRRHGTAQRPLPDSLGIL